eukprot:GHRQ01009793.1.p1 GENE.GHRQ01009793.1~~GHRQ01009793.1.p1  ORF type:complete len:248 (+),score=68.36 GHRQ01009793.1:521-1264(+)
MPRQEPLNDRIVEALEHRRRKCEVLKQQKQFTYKAAIDKIKAMRTNITRPSHVLDLKDVPSTMKEEMVNIINGTAPVEVAPPTPGQLRNAEQRGSNPEFHNPPSKGSGGWCIMLALHDAHCSGKATLTKHQIIRWAGDHLHISLEDGAAGYSKWSNVKNMQKKRWVHRTAYSSLSLRKRAASLQQSSGSSTLAQAVVQAQQQQEVQPASSSSSTGAVPQDLEAQAQQAQQQRRMQPPQAALMRFLIS